VILKCKWFEIFYRRTYVRHDLVSGLYSIDIRREISSSQAKPYVLPEHCEHVFFHPDVFKENWWFVFLVHLRGEKGFENVLVAIVAMSQDDDDVDVSGEVNVGDQVEIRV
jgi:hypothetical protein